MREAIEQADFFITAGKMDRKVAGFFLQFPDALPGFDIIEYQFASVLQNLGSPGGLSHRPEDRFLGF